VRILVVPVICIDICTAAENAASKSPGHKESREKDRKKREKGGKPGRCGMFMGHDFNLRASAPRRSMLLIDPEENEAPLRESYHTCYFPHQ